MDRQIQAQQYVALLEQNPYDLSAIGLLEQTFANNDCLDDLVSLLEERAPTIKSADVAARLYIEAARMAGANLHDFDRGLTLLKQSLTLEGNSELSIESRLFELAFKNDIQQLQNFFVQALEKNDDHVYQSRLYQRMGYILEYILEDNDEADNAYTYALDLDASNLAALRRRQAVAYKDEQWERYAALLKDELQVVAESVRCGELYALLADIYESELNDEKQAEIYRHQAQEFAKQVQDAVSDDNEVKEIVDEEVVEVEEVIDDESIIEVIEEESDQIEYDNPPPPPQHHEIDHALMETQEMDAFMRDDSAQTVANSVDFNSNNFDELLNDLTALVDDNPEASEILAALTHAGRHLSAQRIVITEEFLRLWMTASLVGVEQQFYDNIRHRFEDKELWQTLLESNDSGEINISTTLHANILIFEFQQLDKAQNLVGDEDESFALFFNDIEQAGENWRKLQRELEKRFEDIEEPLRTQTVFIRMANIARALADRDKELYALSRIERDIDDITLLDRLKYLYKYSAKWPKYIEFIYKEIETLKEEDRDEKIGLLYEVIRVYREEMKHDRMAISVYKEVLNLDPVHLLTINNLIDLYGSLNMVSDLIQMLQLKVEAIENTSDKVALYAQIAELFIEKFRNQAEAIKAYEHILELEPLHDQAIRYLKEMHEKRRDWEKLIAISELEINAIDEVDKRANAYREIAILATEKLRKPDIAVSFWEKVLDVFPHDISALDALESLHEKTRDYQALADVLEQKRQVIDDGDSLQKVLHKLGMIYAERLEDFDNATTVWQVSLDLNPDDLKARKALERLYIDAHSWDDLETFYRAYNTTTELVRILETLVGTVKDVETKIELLLRASKLWQEELEDENRLVRNLERVLQLDPAHLEAALWLIPIYENNQDFDKLRDTFSVVVQNSNDSVQKIECLNKLALIHRDQYGAWSPAYDCYVEIFHLAADTIIDTDKLEDSAKQSDRWNDLAQLYRQALDSDQFNDYRHALHLKLARIQAQYIGQADEAIESLQSILETDSENSAALNLLEDVLTQEERWDEVMRIYQRRLSSDIDDDTRIKILHGMAHIYEMHEGDEAAALEYYQQAAQINPTSLTTAQHLHRLHLSHANHDEVAYFIKLQLDLLANDDSLDEEELAQRRAQLHHELGMLSLDILEDDKQAVLSLSEVLAIRPDDIQVQQALELCLSKETVAAQAAKVLGELYKQRSQWSAYIDALEIQISAISDDREKATLLEYVASTQIDELGDSLKGFNAYSRLIQIEPSHPAAREALKQIAGELALWNDYSAAIEDALIGIDETGLKVDYLFELADIYTNRLGAPGRALQYYQEILEIDPASWQALDELEDLYTQTEQWLELLGVYEQKIELVTETRKTLELKFKSAVLWEEFLSDKQAAIAVYRDILDDEPDNVRALNQLARLLEESQNWSELVPIYERQLALVDDDAHDALKLQLGRALSGVSGRVEDAITIFDNLLVNPDYQSAAIQGLETILTLPGEHRDNVAKLLVPVYEQNAQWNELVGALSIKVEFASDVTAREDIYRKMAIIQEEHLQDSQAAFDTTRQLLHIDPTNADTLQQLYRTAASLEPAVLAAAFENEAHSQDDVEIRCELLRKSFVVYNEHLQDDDKSIQLLCDIIELMPEDMDALNQLEAIYLQQQKWQQLIDILLHKLEYLSNSNEKRDVLIQVATLFEDTLEKPLQAIDVYNRILEIISDDKYALERLEALYRREGQWHELLDTLEKLISCISEPDEKREKLLSMAQIYHQNLHQYQQSIDIYNQALALDDTREDVLNALATLYEQSEQWHELIDIVEQQMTHATDVDYILDLKFKVGEIWRLHLGDQSKAIDIYATILEVASDHEPSLTTLHEITTQSDDPDKAAKLLESMFLRMHAWPELVALYVGWAENTSDGMPSELYARAARIYDEQLDLPRKALTAYLESLHTAPEVTDILSQIERLTRITNQWQAWVDYLVERLPDEMQLERALPFYCSLAKTYELELAAPEDAIATWTKVLELDPENSQAIQALERLYQGLADWDALADVLNQRIVITQEAEERAEIQLRLGTLYTDALDDDDAAIDQFEAVLVDGYKHDQASQALNAMAESGRAIERVSAILEPYYHQNSRFQDLVDLNLHRIRFSDDAEQNHHLLVANARLYLEELQDPKRAMATYGAALVQKCDSIHIVDEIMQLAGSTQSWEQAASMIADALSVEYVPDDAALYLWSKLAYILDEQMQRRDDAVLAYEKVLEIESSNDFALHGLERIYTQLAQWEDLARILQYRIDSTYDEQELIARYFQLAQLQQQSLDNVDVAISLYETILSMQPDHAKAAQELEMVFIEYQRWEQLYAFLEMQAQLTLDAQRQSEIYKRMAGMAEEVLDKHDDVVDLWSRVLSINPDDEDALRELHRLYKRDEQWDDLAIIIEREVELSEDESRTLQLGEELGHIHLNYRHSSADAASIYSKVLELEPGHLDALYQLKEIYTQQGDYNALVSVIESLLQLPDNSLNSQIDLWAELAAIYNDALVDLDRAADAWKHVLSLDTNHGQALERLEETLIQLERWQEIAQLLELKAEQLTNDDDKLVVLERLAQTYEVQLDDKTAAANIYEQILDIEGSHLVASRAVEMIYLEDGSPEALQSLVNIYLNRSAQLHDQPFEKLEVLREASRLFEEHLAQPESALIVLLSGLNETTIGEHQLTNDIERLANQTDMWSEVVAQYRDVLTEIGDGNYDPMLNKQLGLWLAHKLDQPDEAVQFLQAAYKATPDDVEVVALLQQLYERLALWPKLAELFNQQIMDAVSDSDRLSLLHQLGTLLEQQIGDIDEAINVYQRILDVDPNDLDALLNLERAYEAYDRWDELVEILSRRVENTYDPDENIALKLRIASLWEDRLQDNEQAIELYHDILVDDPANHLAADALEALYLQVENWQALGEHYEQCLRVADHPEKQVAYYERLATLNELHFEDAHAAIDAYRQILLINPSHLGAMEQLSTLYAQVGQWEDIAAIWHAHLDDLDDPVARIELLLRLAGLYEHKIKEPHAAIEALQQILEIDPAHVEVIESLARLYEKTAGWDAALDYYQQLGELLDDPLQQAQAMYQSGAIYQYQLHDLDNAEARYLDALSLSAEHRPTLLALTKLYKDKQDWQGVLHAYRQLESISQDFSEKAYYLCQLAKIYQGQLADDDNALNHYEKALEYDPEVADAAQPLVTIYLDQERWERAVPLLQTLLEQEQDGDNDGEILYRLHQQLAISYENLEQDEAALREYLSSYELKPNDKITLIGLGRLLHEHGEFEQAHKVFQVLLTRHIENLERDEQADIYYKMGLIAQANDDMHKAHQYLDKVLEVDPNHKPSLRVLVDLFTGLEKWPEVVRYKRAMLRTENDPTVAFASYVEVGDICVNRLERIPDAIAAYREALEIDPKSVVILSKLLELCTRERQWSEAIGLLNRMADIETDSNRKANLYYTIAVICRDQLKEPEDALRYFERALETDGSLLKAFEAIERVLTSLKDWKGLERAYLKMLKRVGSNTEPTMENIKALLWQNLGEIYRSRLGDLPKAIETYEVAVGFAPKSDQLRLILAELYQRVGDNPNGIIEQHKELLKIDPFRIESYSLLYKAYIQIQEYDKAWCMAGVLSYLRKATEQEEKFYRQYLRQDIEQAKKSFDPELYKLLYHPEQDLMISYIMGLLGQGLRNQYSQPVNKTWGVHKRKNLLNLDEPSLFSRVYNYGVRTLAVVPSPVVYLQAEQALGIRNANSDPPAIIIGGDIRQNSNDRVLKFLVGKTLCWMLPQHYLGSIGYPTEFLRILFMAAMELTEPSLNLREQLGPQGEDILQKINAMPGPMLLQMQKLMRQYLAMGENPNLSQWLRSIEFTTDRAGLLLCGDIHEAAECIRNGHVAGNKTTPKQKVRELILFAMSDEYFELRERLGLAIGK